MSVSDPDMTHSTLRNWAQSNAQDYTYSLLIGSSALVMAIEVLRISEGNYLSLVSCLFHGTAPTWLSQS